MRGPRLVWRVSTSSLSRPWQRTRPAGNGTVVVWDLKQNKAWCELRCESSGAAVADMAWNPSEGLHLLTASSDDRNPVLKLCDLRSSTTVPLTTLQGHQQGILSMSWCPHDESMLLT